MDFRSCVIDPARLDNLRGIVEDELACRSIEAQKTNLGVLPSLLFPLGYVSGFGVLVQDDRPTFTAGFLFSVRALEFAGIEFVAGSRLSGTPLAQALALELPSRCLLSHNRTDLSLGLILQATDAACEVTHSPDTFLRHYSEGTLGSLWTANRLRIIADESLKAQHSCAKWVNPDRAIVQLPQTRDCNLPWAHRRLLRSQERKKTSRLLDPFVEDYVSGLEHWHLGNLATDFFTNPPEQRAALVEWIKRVFVRSRTAKPCPGSSYGLKHIFEYWDLDAVSGGITEPFYVTNGTFKGAMIAAGHLPLDANELNPLYQVKWSDEIKLLRRSKVSQSPYR